ncbi:MAG: hypothetical protein J6S78_05955 [Lachnospiraceae bacterium]|nr:hypothetical protein [Lachnospiraceae bacterium]
MDKFLMICYVAADFAGPDGQLFRVTPENIGVFIEVPGWVKNTLLFKMLMKDSSVRIADKSQKELENDPMVGVGADGKKAEKPAEVTDTKVIKTKKEPTKATAKKKDDA